jgi:thiol-disulfide isomerase/thioredoxin
MSRNSKDRWLGEREDSVGSARKPSRLYSITGSVVVAVAVVALAIGQLSGGNTVEAQSAPASGVAGEAAGIVGDAASLDVAASYPGKVVVVNYMAGWCQSCWGEIPGFIDVYEEYKGRGVVMIGISLQTPREQTQTMIDRLGIPYPVYQDLEGNVALNRFRLKTMPTTLIFKDGQLTYRLDGEVSAQVLRSYVEDAL